MSEQLLPTHLATPATESELEEFRNAHDLDGTAELIAATKRVESAQSGLERIEANVVTNGEGPDGVDTAVAGYIEDAHGSGDAPFATQVGVQEVAIQESPLTARELDKAEVSDIGAALHDLSLVNGDDAVETVIERIEAAEMPPVMSDEEMTQRLNERAAKAPSSDQWREDLFGTKEIEAYTEDLNHHLETPDELRSGDAVYDTVTGKERRPIMDISLDSEAKEALAEKLAMRSQSLRDTLVRVREIDSGAGTGEEKAFQIEQLLQAARKGGAWEEKLGNITQDYSGPGTIADLYIGPDDMAMYDEVDEIANRLSGRNIVDSRKEIEARLMMLAACTFPAGVELVHSTDNQGLESIMRQGDLSPRSNHRYGAAGARTSIAGGTVHMTGPGRKATAYGNDTIYVPIETIMQHSPILQFENSYVGNAFTPNSQEIAQGAREGRPSISIQQPMTKVTFNHPKRGDMPKIFSDYLAQMHKNLDEGTQLSLLGQGEYDNYGFVQSNQRETAGKYKYPLDDLTVHYTNPKLKNPAEKFHREYGLKMRPKNFSYSNDAPLTVYAPLTTHRVPFTEQAIGEVNEGRARATLDTTYPDAVPSRLRELLIENPDNNYDDVLKVAVENVRPGDGLSFLQLYRDFRHLEAAKGDTGEPKMSEKYADDIIEKLPIETLSQLAYFIEGDVNDPANDSAFSLSQKQRLAERLREQKDKLPPDWITMRLLHDIGFVPTDDEVVRLKQHETEKAREELEHTNRPSVTDLNF